MSTTISAASLRPLLLSLRRVLQYHAIISFLLVMGVLTYCAFSIGQIMLVESDPDYESQQLSKRVVTAFDEKTAEKVENLRTRNDTETIVLPGDRYNPFLPR